MAGLLTLFNLCRIPGGLSGHGPVDGAPWLFAAAATMLLGRVLRGQLSRLQLEEDAVGTVQDGGWRGAEPAAETVAAHRRHADEAFARRYGD